MWCTRQMGFSELHIIEGYKKETLLSLNVLTLSHLPKTNWRLYLRQSRLKTFPQQVFKGAHYYNQLQWPPTRLTLEDCRLLCATSMISSVWRRHHGRCLPTLRNFLLHLGHCILVAFEWVAIVILSSCSSALERQGLSFLKALNYEAISKRNPILSVWPAWDSRLLAKSVMAWKLLISNNYLDADLLFWLKFNLNHVLLTIWHKVARNCKKSKLIVPGEQFFWLGTKNGGFNWV